MIHVLYDDKLFVFLMSH